MAYKGTGATVPIHMIKACKGGGEVQLHSFLTSALDGGGSGQVSARPA